MFAFQFKVVGDHYIVVSYNGVNRQLTLAIDNDCANVIADWLNDYRQFASEDQLMAMMRICGFSSIDRSLVR